MERMIQEIRQCQGTLVKIVMSDRLASAEYNKIDLRLVELKGELYWQAERYKNNQVFHCNIKDVEFESWLLVNSVHYRQINLVLADLNASYIRRSNGKYRRVQTASKVTRSVSTAHNKTKNYILREGENIPALIDLGIFSSEYKVIKSKNDKYKQINRFVELIDDIYSGYDRTEITILDFGSGKSYLTFIVYYYFVVIKGINAKIIGYDLKADVVADCNLIAKKYGYDNLTFEVADVASDNLYNIDIDMVITLHACDTATDHALYNAIKHNVPHILSVPCCQHEVNHTIKSGGDCDILLSHGLIKERFSALLTDSIRAKALEQYGYDVDMLEFVDFSHSPKNLMIRARKTKTGARDLSAVKGLMEKYQISHTLIKLLDGMDK